MGSWSRELSRGRGVILGRGLHVIRANSRLYCYLPVQSAKKKLACKQAVPNPPPPRQPREPGESLLASYQEIKYRGLSKWNFEYFNSDDIRRSTSEALNLGYKLDFGRFLGQPFIINFHPT